MEGDITIRKLSTLFTSLALGVALFAGAPGAANAEQPLQQCKVDSIIKVFDTGAKGVQAFGSDGCVYNVISNTPLAVHNYDLHDQREAQAFSRAYNNAQRTADRQNEIDQRAFDREIQRQQRLEEAQRKRCDQAKSNAAANVLRNVINKRPPRYGNDAANVLRQCGTGLF